MIATTTIEQVFLETIPPSLFLPDDEVHIWQLYIPSLFNTRKEDYYLKTEELTKANKFAFEKDKQRFIIARSILRQLISIYLNLSIEKIRFSCNSYGKPFLKIKFPTIEFNISHSGDYVLIAFSKEHPLGIDIEYLGKNVDFISIAKRFFTLQEYDAIKKSPVQNQKIVFFKHWTQKEAIIKMLGKGLSIGLKNINPDSTEFYTYEVPSPANYQATVAATAYIKKLTIYAIN